MQDNFIRNDHREGSDSTSIKIIAYIIPTCETLLR